LKFAILPLNSHCAWGGSEILWSSLVRYWHGLGHEVAICIKDWQQMPEPILSLEEAEIPLKRYDQRSSLLNRIAAKIKHKGGIPTPLHPLENWLREMDPDLMLFSADGMSGMPGMQLAAKLSIPYAFIMQANSETWWPSDPGREAMNSAIDQAGGAICFVGERNRDLFELQLGRRLPNALTVRNPHAALGMDPLPWPEPSATDAGAELLRMAFVGRQEPIAKGQDILFQVLAQSQWRERHWTLTLYGGGSGTEGVKAMAEMLGISGRLSFVPSYSSIQQVWSKAHVLVLASRYEGLPLALSEAMTLGRPAVVTDVADCAILLRDGLDGFVASSPSVAAYADAMERLWQNRSKLPQMGANAAQRAQDFLPQDPVRSAAEAILAIPPTVQHPPCQRLRNQ
jgi:glycosyltransferase involved in cell wall biosynthesis